MRLWPCWGVLAGCVWLAFSPALRNGFVDWDDPKWILENRAFRGLGWEQIRFAFTTFTGGVYQPLGWLVQSLTYAIYGLEPRGYHLVSLLFHVANVVLLHVLCVRLVARGMPRAAMQLGRKLPWLCAVPVGLYGVHPLRVEMVAWASPQAYLPSITLSLLATLAYLRAHPAGGERRRSWLMASFSLVALAALTKGSAVVLPLVFLILDAYPLGRFEAGRSVWPTSWRALIEKLPILIPCLGLTGVAFVAKASWIDPEVSTQPVFVGRVAQACFGAWFYLAKTAWPFGLTAYYPRPEDEDFGTPFFAACVAGAALALVAAFGLRKKRPWLPAAMSSYLVMASPYLGLARVSVTLASDRYGHAPTMAWVVVGAAGLCRLAPRRWSRAALLGSGAGLLALTSGLMALCGDQCRVWESNHHLWSDALANAPWSARLHDYMGTTLANLGRLDEAVAEFREARRIRPHDFDSTCNLGVALDRRGETDAAISLLREALRLQPRNAKVHLNLGAALERKGAVEEALALYREGLRLEPDFPELRLNLGIALAGLRKLDEAIEELTRATRLRPDSAAAHAALGGVFALRGELDGAISHYRKALQLDPGHSASRLNLGLALARHGRHADAIAELREATGRDRGNPEAHHILASVLVAAGRLGEATAEFEEVLRLRPDHPQARAFLAMSRGRRF